MGEDDLKAKVRELLGEAEAHVARYRTMLELLEAEGPVVLPAKRKGGKTAKPAKVKASKEGEQRPRKQQSGGRVGSAERKAKALALLAQGKTPKDVAKELGVTPSAIYLYQRSAK